MSKSKHVVLFLVHVWSEEIVARFIEMQRSVGKSVDIFMLIDERSPDVLSFWKHSLSPFCCSDCIISFTPRRLEARLGYRCLVAGQMVGATHYPVLNFWKSKSYQYYWVTEFDVVLAGNWNDFMTTFESVDADLLLSHLVRYESDPNWYWWNSLVPPGKKFIFQMLRLFGRQKVLAEIITKKNAPKGFLPLYRISWEGLRCVDAAHRAGWKGHYEVLLPTVLDTHGLSVKDFNEYGDYYTKGPLSSGDGSPPFSSFRWRPEISPSEMLAAEGVKIFHPLK